MSNQNLKLLDHFDKLTYNGIKVLKLKAGEREKFLNKLPKPFRILYLSEEELKKRLEKFKTQRTDEILEKIPTRPNIQSGEFAELLLYYLLPEEYSKGEYLNPVKWKWKFHKDRALQFTDVVILHRHDKVASVNDYIIAVESKAGATKPAKDESRLKEAKEGSEDDYLGRLAESLVFLKARYKDELNTEAVDWIERFMEVPRYPSYAKLFKAVGVVDANYSKHHLDNVDPKSNIIKTGLELILISIDDLKSAYEKVYSEMHKT